MMQAVFVPGGGAAAPPKVEPNTSFPPLSRQRQQPPKLVLIGTGLGRASMRFPPQHGDAATFFTPRCQRSGRPASSALNKVVDVPSVICSIETGRLFRRRIFQFST